MASKAGPGLVSRAWKKLRTLNRSAKQRESSEYEGDVELIGDDQTGPHTSVDPATPSGQFSESSADTGRNDASMNENESPTGYTHSHYTEPRPTANSQEEPIETSENGIPNLENEDQITQDNLTKPPLNSRYPEVIPFIGHDGEACSALALTSTMIWQWNMIIRGDMKIATYIKELEETHESQERVEKIIEDLHLKIVRAGEDPEFDHNHILEQFNTAQEIKSGFQMARQTLEDKIQKVKEDMRIPQAQLIRDLQEVLADHNLLDPIPNEFEQGSQLEVVEEGDHYVEIKQKTPTPSEARRWAAADAREAAVEDMHQKEQHLQDCRELIDQWHEYYDAEYRKYCECVADGTMKPDRTMFDNHLLHEEQQATHELIQAEHDFEEARKHARELGAYPHHTDLESGFPDYMDDGYRLSMEASLKEQVDRDRIRKWIRDQLEDDKTVHSDESDDWEAKPVDLSDSVSVVAEGKERRRIDRWRSMCEQVGVESTGVPE